MDFKTVLAIVDKHVDEKGLALDLGKELVMPMVKKALAGIDLIPGTDLDNKAIEAVIEFLEKQITGAAA